MELFDTIVGYYVLWKPIINPDKSQCASALDLKKTRVPDVSYLSSVPHVRTPCDAALLRRCCKKSAEVVRPFLQYSSTD